MAIAFIFFGGAMAEVLAALQGNPRCLKYLSMALFKSLKSGGFSAIFLS
jgi:hypothetical protein